MTQTHLQKCEERRRIKTKEREMYAVSLQVTMHLSCLSNGLGEGAGINVPLSGLLVDLLLPGSNYRADDKSRCWRGMGLNVQINVGQTAGIKTCSVSM